MRFWDSSAIVPLLVAEGQTGFVRILLEADSGVVVWWSTVVECASALRRRERDGVLSAMEVREARGDLEVLAGLWTEVRPAARVRSVAERLLAVHPLRAADALQLAAAIRWCEGAPEGAPFVCLDERLREAAGREGFGIMPAG